MAETEENRDPDSEALSGAEKLDLLVESHPLPTWRPVAWAFMILIALGLGWAFTARLDEVTVAEGEVVPKGDLKVIQHLEGGIIQEIFVTEGSKVKAGDRLIQLDIASSGLNREELQVRLDGQLALRARLDAEAKSGKPEFPADLRARSPVSVTTQQRTFDARAKELATTVSVLNRQIRQRELEVREVGARLNSTTRNLALAQERFQISAELLEQKLVPRDEHLKLEAEVQDLEGEIQTLEASMPRTRSAVDEAKDRRRETSERFLREAQDELGGVGDLIARIQENLAVASEKGARLEVKSPIDGIVKNMRYTTVGGVVQPGEAIMEIVPTGAQLVIEAKLNPVDRGFVTEGQAVRVKISTYDFVRYGALDGTVTLVAPDATEEADGTPYFQVVVEMEKTYLGQEAGQLPITPGMQATIDIHTGTKTVIDFLIKPVLKMKAEAFRER